MEFDEVRHALASLDEDGFVVLENAVDPAHLDILKERMLADVAKILARPDAPFNFNAGNIQQAPPPFAPYLFSDVLFNERVIAVTHALFGDGVKNAFYSGNTALRSDARQPVHPDVAQLWPNLAAAPPAFGVVVNVPVVDVDERNGATQLWPGTHKDTTLSIRDGSIRVPESALERWREKRPPLQPTVKRGSVILRDIRLWHAGMPNYTDEPRPMIAMIHWPHWYHAGDAVEIPESSTVFFQHPVLHTRVRVVENLDHTRHGGAYDYRPEETDS